MNDDDLPATLADIKAAVDRAFQLGRLTVIGEVNIQRVRALRERYDNLLEKVKDTPTDELIRKLKRVRKQLIRACETGVRHEDTLRKMTDART